MEQVLLNTRTKLKMEGVYEATKLLHELRVCAY